MINLLPENKKLLIHNEYRQRVTVVVLFFLLVLALLAVVLLLPSYFLIFYREQAASGKANIVQTPQATAERASLEAKIAADNDMIAALSKPVSTSPLEIINTIAKDESSDISVTEIDYSSSDGSSFDVSIQGVAGNRQSLLAFTEALKAESNISTIDLPVSDYAKDSDISFSFDIKGTL